ncbi:MAG: tRNA (adenosine(37)-N6)-dimethylallyltransferase MiaA [Salinivirgaceae bacterium]|nr:tRNA (adenosine(37)-N6)-dimethylallyltransferase MiaA [Salinivirgaceae bacterium]
MTQKKNTLVVLIGPTGIGKTDLSIHIAQNLQCEIISCDSRQMYRELKIGTAAPEAKHLNAVPHHFIGNLSIHDYYNASEFEFQTLELVDQLFTKNNFALMTGGSGLYIDAVVKGIDELPTIDPEIRNNLKSRLKTEGLDALIEELKNVDPNYYEIADLKNPKRILKALEIYTITGKAYSTFRTDTIKERQFNIIQVGLNMDREELYDRINLRVDLMLEAGLIEEAKQFHRYKNLNSLNTVGYKELFGHFDGEYDLDEAIRLIKRNSRRYAKRQMTWFNRDKSISWFHPNQIDEIMAHIRKLSLI